MKNFVNNFCFFIVISFLSSSIFASDSTTWDFRSNNGSLNNIHIDGNHYGNTGTISEDGISIRVSAWSDTDDSNHPDYVESARLATGSYGLLSYNREEGNSTSNCAHCVDNVKNGSSSDYDMLLFEFSTAVSLTQFNFGWVMDGGSYSSTTTADFSVAAFSSLPQLGGESDLSGLTWGNIAGLSTRLASRTFSDYSNNSVVSFLGDATNTLVEAKYWLVGARNSVFGVCCGEIENDGFKLRGLTAHISDNTPPPPTEANAPSAGLLFAVGVILFEIRRRRTQYISLKILA